MSVGAETTCPLSDTLTQSHNNTALQSPIRVNQIITQCKETYLTERVSRLDKKELRADGTPPFELSQHIVS